MNTGVNTNLRGALFNPQHLVFRAAFNTGTGKMDTVNIKNLREQWSQKAIILAPCS